MNPLPLTLFLERFFAFDSPMVEGRFHNIRWGADASDLGLGVETPPERFQQFKVIFSLKGETATSVVDYLLASVKKDEAGDILFWVYHAPFTQLGQIVIFND